MAGRAKIGERCGDSFKQALCVGPHGPRSPFGTVLGGIAPKHVVAGRGQGSDMGSKEPERAGIRGERKRFSGNRVLAVRSIRRQSLHHIGTRSGWISIFPAMRVALWLGHGRGTGPRNAIPAAGFFEVDPRGCDLLLPTVAGVSSPSSLLSSFAPGGEPNSGRATLDRHGRKCPFRQDVRNCSWAANRSWWL